MLRENQCTELKLAYTEDVRKTVAAFANTLGGELFIGVDDDGSVVGLENPEDVLLRVSNAVRDAIRPDVSMFCDYAVQEIDGKRVAVIRVQRGTSAPYYLTKKGLKPEGVFVRQGASTVPASEAAILRMIRETAGVHYEDARSLDQHLTFQQTTKHFQQEQLQFGLTQQATLKLLGDDGTYTNLALLLSEQCMHTIRIAQFEGSHKTTFKDRREFSGSVLKQLEDAFEYIDQYNRTRAEFVGLRRVDSRDYPPEALREALLNAIVHREYSYGDSTLISMFQDRLEIVSVGGLVGTLTLEDIMLGLSILRNPRLANIFYRLNLIEAYGTGIQRIRQSYAGQSLQPIFEVTDNAFKVTLPNRNYLRQQEAPQSSSMDGTIPLSQQETLLLNLLSQAESITRAQAQQALGVSQTTAIDLLREMQRKGLVVRRGQGKNTVYQTGQQPSRYVQAAKK